MLKTKIISAFPASGKTHLFDNIHREFTVLDSDSSKFSWIIDGDGNKVRNPEFPKNYIEHIKNNIGRVNFIFVSTHKVVRDALKEAGIDFIVVIPENDVDTKREWIRRCISRGNDSNFCDIIATYWTEWLEEIERNENNYNIIKIRANQYLSDIIDLKGNINHINERG